MILNLEIILYSIIQGLTEFLPVSSSAHLYFLEKFYKWEDIGVIFPLAAHLGTLIAVIVHQKNKIFRIVMIDIIEDSNYILIKIIIISILPTLIIGILLATILSKYYNFSLLAIGISTIIGAMLLEISDRKKCNSINLSDLSYKKSVFIGFFQTLSLIPGMSRSGSVITAMRFLGIDRKTSISFSLLSGIPIIFAACTFSIYNIIYFKSSLIYSFFFISFCSFIVGYLSIRFMLIWVEKFSFRIFVFYRLVLGTFIILYYFN